ISFNSLAPVLSAHVILDPTGRPRATLGRYSIIPRALTARVFGAGTRPRLRSSPTTKVTSLLRGLHSAIVTLSPSAADMHGGLWARVLLLRLSYLLYFV